jgi:Tfp pilus assembly protein PilX
MTPIQRGSQRGVVLPIVLVVMMVVTVVVITQVKRGTVDERLAGNWSRTMSRQAATESLVRYCEAFILRKDEVRKWCGVVPSENYPNTPAWNSNLPASDVVTFQQELLPPGATGAVCVVEDATSELGGTRYAQGPNPGSEGPRDPYLWKFRFTVLVTYQDTSLFGSVVHRTQSEVRFVII